MVECHRMLVRYLKTCLVQCPQCPPSQSIGRANDFSSGHIKCKTVYGVYDSMLASSTWNAATKVDSRRHEPNWTKASGIWRIIARTRTIHHRHPFWKLKQNSKSSLTSWQFKSRNCHHIQLCGMWNSSQELIQIILLWTWVQRQQTAGDYTGKQENCGKRRTTREVKVSMNIMGFRIPTHAACIDPVRYLAILPASVRSDRRHIDSSPSTRAWLSRHVFLTRKIINSSPQPMWPAPSQKSAGLAGLSSTPWSTKNTIDESISIIKLRLC